MTGNSTVAPPIKQQQQIRYPRKKSRREQQSSSFLRHVLALLLVVVFTLHQFFRLFDVTTTTTTIIDDDVASLPLQQEEEEEETNDLIGLFNRSSFSSLSSLSSSLGQEPENDTTTTTTTKAINSTASTTSSQKQTTLPRAKYWFEMKDDNDDASIYNPNLQTFSTSHPKERKDRFPSVEERIEMYMGNWYIPRCKNNNDSSMPFFNYTIGQEIDTKNNNNNMTYRFVEMQQQLPIFNNDNTTSSSSPTLLRIDTHVRSDQTFLLDRRIIIDCARSMKQYQAQTTRNDGVPLPTEDRVHDRESNHWRCEDVLDMWFPGTTRKDKRRNDQSLLFVRFGDDFVTENFPLFAKVRPAANNSRRRNKKASKKNVTCLPLGGRPPLDNNNERIMTSSDSHIMMSPILWKIESRRHFGEVGRIHEKDIGWEEKKNQAIWLGVMTGLPMEASDNNNNNETTSILTPLDCCKRNQRCNFVLQHYDSKLVMAGLTSTLGRLNEKSLNTDFNTSLLLLRKPLSLEQMLKYKIIISLEGNDVSSGLKWNLMSNSVVMMPKPTLTTWAMEEYLEPWVHYIPIYPNGTNTEDMVRWVQQNDDKARMIAERSTLFMKDLVGDPKEDVLDVTKKHWEEVTIKQQIRERYYQLWYDD